MLEAILALGAFGIAVIGLMLHYAESVRADARHAALRQEAAQLLEFAALVHDWGTLNAPQGGSAVSTTAATLIADGFAPAGFSATTPLGRTITGAAIQDTAGNLTVLAVTTGTVPMRYAARFGLQSTPAPLIQRRVAEEMEGIPLPLDTEGTRIVGSGILTLNSSGSLVIDDSNRGREIPVSSLGSLVNDGSGNQAAVLLERRLQ